MKAQNVIQTLLFLPDYLNFGTSFTSSYWDVKKFEKTLLRLKIIVLLYWQKNKVKYRKVKKKNELYYQAWPIQYHSCMISKYCNHNLCNFIVSRPWFESQLVLFFLSHEYLQENEKFTSLQYSKIPKTKEKQKAFFVIPLGLSLVEQVRAFIDCAIFAT